MKKSALFSILYVGFVLAVFTIVRAQTPANSQNSSLTRPRTVASSAPQQQASPAPSVTPTPYTAPQSVTPTVLVPPMPMSTPLWSPPTSISSVTSLALQPAPVIAPNKARARIQEAQRLLRTRLQPTGLTPPIWLVTIAALDNEASQIHLVSFPKQTLLTPNAETTLATSHGKTVRLRIVRPNYVNTAVIISDLNGRQLTPLLIEYPIEKGGRFTEMAYYTSVHPALMSPELVKSGQAYVRNMLDMAVKRLRDKGYVITPEIIDVAERLCIVEHVDHGRFRNESRLAIYEEVYALYALNELDTYRYSVSWAGAGGMVQMIPATYQMIRRLYPGAGLNPDFVVGMRNHGNALEAMLLYMQRTWTDLMLNPDVSYAYQTGQATQAELLSAGYNSNPARLGLYLRRGGTAWRTLIPRETQMYLQIYRSFESLVPFKGRADKS